MYHVARKAVQGHPLASRKSGIVTIVCAMTRNLFDERSQRESFLAKVRVVPSGLMRILFLLEVNSWYFPPVDLCKGITFYDFPLKLGEMYFISDGYYYRSWATGYLGCHRVIDKFLDSCSRVSTKVGAGLEAIYVRTYPILRTGWFTKRQNLWSQDIG